MGKRIFCACLAAVLLLGLIVLPQDTSAASSMKFSEEIVAFIKVFEGFSAVPYTSSSGKYFIGYGTSCPDDLIAQYQQTPMTEEQADAELRRMLSGYEATVNQFIDKHGLKYEQRQFDAVLSLVYNVGASWLSKDNILVKALTSGATGNELIYAFTIYSTSGGRRSVGHIRRRLAEAAVYLEGSYSRIAPDKYCYVLYDAQGGTISAMGGTYNVQGYDGELTAPVAATASRSGYEFKGWFTEKTGGTQVTVLDMSTKGMTLYAQWAGEEQPTDPSVPTEPSQPTDPTEPDAPTDPTESSSSVATQPSVPQGEPVSPVEVTVTVSALNVRKGPGATYESVGMLSRGEVVTVSAVYQGEDYLWGKTASGWIALENTDYSAEAEPTDPPETEPTQPVTDSTTQPVTDPTTESTTEATAPPTTQPSVPEGEEISPVQVTVTVSALNIRTGPGTNYDSLGLASRGDTFTVSAVYQGENNLWGKTASGWIALENTDYDEVIQLPEDPTEPEEDTQQPSDTEPSTEPELPADPEMPPEGTGLYATVVNTASLNVRQEPGGTVITTLHLGDRVRVLEQKYAPDGLLWGRFEQGWIRLGAYVKLETVAIEDEPAAPEEPTQPDEELPSEPEMPDETMRLFACVTHSGAVPVYAERNGERAGTLAPGDRVEIFALTRDGQVQWAQCRQGWIVIRSYVKLERVPVEQADECPALVQPAIAIITTATVTADSVSLYADPNGEKAGVLKAGVTKELTLCRVDGEAVWGLSDQGWLRLDEGLELSAAEEGDGIPGVHAATVAAASLNFRLDAGNSSAVLCRLSQDMIVTVLEMKAADGVVWARTEFGWVNMDYVTRVR